VPSTFASEDLCNISKAATDTSIQVPIPIDWWSHSHPPCLLKFLWKPNPVDLQCQELKP
jgi:hypothetical protein